MKNGLIMVFILIIGFFALQGDIIAWMKSKGYENGAERAKRHTQESLIREMQNRNYPPATKEQREKLENERRIRKENARLDREYSRNNKRKRHTSHQKPEIKQYTTSRAELFVGSRCRSCGQARSFLKKHGVRILEFDIRHDKVARARHKRLDPHGRLPLAIINGRVVVNFDRQKYIDALEHN